MRMNIQPRVVGEKIDYNYIMELSKYRCSKEGGWSQTGSILYILNV